MELIKVIVLGLVLSIITVLMKSIKPEYSLICVIVGSIILVMYILSGVQSIFDYFSEIVSKTGIDNVMFKTLLKIIGVGYLVEFSAGVCIDSGNSSIADKIVLAGKVLIFSLSIPIISNLFNMIMDLI
ncbi:MAG: stage III sporulation AC/AD family protein [Firmicutes bacterium]|nr:stage III sporulation AC/AD family protein [Bacillota bacterium]MDY5676943.1 SpoIIIAC/SpoIIIAD family protein [Eubacteriales bacterium]